MTYLTSKLSLSVYFTSIIYNLNPRQQDERGKKNQSRKYYMTFYSNLITKLVKHLHIQQPGKVVVVCVDDDEVGEFE